MWGASLGTGAQYPECLFFLFLLVLDPDWPPHCLAAVPDDGWFGVGQCRRDRAGFVSLARSPPPTLCLWFQRLKTGKGGSSLSNSRSLQCPPGSPWSGIAPQQRLFPSLPSWLPVVDSVLPRARHLTDACTLTRGQRLATGAGTVRVLEAHAFVSLYKTD